MKRTVAAIGAAVVGLSGVLVASAPAQAATTPDCTTFGSGTTKSNPASGSFYMDCVPQYGLGKTSIDISNEEGIVDGFELSDTTDAAITTTVDAEEFSTYVGNSFPFDAPVLTGLDSSTTTGQKYSGLAFVPVASAQKIATSSLPKACTASKAKYDGAYKITFEPLNATFTTTVESGQTVEGAPGKYFVPVRAQSLYIAANFAPATESENPSGFDSDAAQCWSSGTNSGFVKNGTGDNENAFGTFVQTATGLLPTVTTMPAVFSPLGTAPTVSVATKIGYGTPTLPVKVSGTSTYGVVSAAVDARLHTAAAVSAGTAKVAVSPSLSIGTHEVAVEYSGNSLQAAKTKSTTFVVTKATTTSSLKLNKTKATKKSTRLVATATVKVPGTAVVATGKVAFTVNGKVVKTVTLKNGKATGTLPTFAKTGKAKVVAKYLGSTKLVTDSSSTVTVKVK